MIDDDLRSLFEEESAVIMESGRRGDGKTDFALRIGEDALDEGLISRIASNIKTDDPRVDNITNLPDLRTWLSRRGKKYFVLDEAGKILKRMGFMSKMNKMILDIIQLIRHYDGYFTAIAPSEAFIDSNYLNTDILDCKIKKVGLYFAEVKNFLTREVYTLTDIERTSIKFWSKDVATFTLEKPMNVAKFSVEEECAYNYGHGVSMDVIGEGLQPKKHRQQVARMIQKYLVLHFKELKTCNKSSTRVEV